MGLARALVMILVILWTNPALNADGTRCTDLSLIRFHYTHEASRQQYVVDYPLWWDDPDTGQRVWRSLAGAPDSAEVALPHSTRDYDWWWITAFAVDFTGNVSDSSNTIGVTAPTGP